MSAMQDKKFAKLRARLDVADDETLKFFADPDTCFIARTLLQERGVSLPVPKTKKVKHPSKADQWSTASVAALDALNTLEELRSGWADTYNNLSEGLQQGPFGQKCEAMDNLDLQSAIDTVSEAEGMEVPLGFGRD